MVLDSSDLLLDVWPNTADDWSTLFDRISIPPSLVRRGVVFDGKDPLVAELGLTDRDVFGQGVTVIRDVGCPECGRPVIVIYKPWGTEPREAILNEIRGSLESTAWHNRHPTD